MQKQPRLNRYNYHTVKNESFRTRRQPIPKLIAWIPGIERFYRLSRKRKIALLALIVVAVLAILTLFTTIYFAGSLGSKESLMNRNKTGVSLLDQNGQVFYEFYNAHSSTYVTLDKISEPTKQAVIASEDKDFYKHAGFSIKGIANAVYQNLKPGGINSGGSTITQQLVKNALLTKQRSIIRKYQELVLSIEIERRYSKDQILEMYLNSVYFGDGAFGIEDAAHKYFNKPAAELNAAEASMLIGVLPAPSVYSPISGDRTKAETRQSYVLDRMQKDGYLSKEEQAAADAQPLAYNPNRQNDDYKAPHFALMVKDELEKKYGEETIARSGYKVTTTLNLDWQSKAEAAVAKQVQALSYSKVSNGAAMVIDPKNGEVRALVGSHDWNDETNGKINMATATRQPGSSFKPIVYASGIENRKFTAATIWEDKPTDLGGYAPKNYDLRWHGDVTTRKSLANSYNIPAVLALQKDGIDSTRQTAENLGITTMKNARSLGLPMALGAGEAKLTEMTNAYATLANQGRANDLTLYTAISNKENKQIYKYQPKQRQAISAQTSYIMSSMMSDNAARSPAFGSSLNLYGNRPAAVKTGTTDNYKDAWTIGFTPSLTVGVWIGNNNNSPMSSVAGSSGAAPIWRSLMQQLVGDSKFEQFQKPADITERLICPTNGGLADNKGDNTITEYFRPGTLPNNKCNEKPKEEEKPQEIKPEEKTPETTTVSAKAPVFTDVCGAKNDTWQASTSGVTYTEKWTSSTLTITATAKDGYTLDGASTWTHLDDSTSGCDIPPPADNPTNPPVTPTRP